MIRRVLSLLGMRFLPPEDLEHAARAYCEAQGWKWEDVFVDERATETVFKTWKSRMDGVYITVDARTGRVTRASVPPR